ncbi:MAG: hypothetical protein KJT03_24090, partial [Verrucomicrobiae bacterium]|nr:hypothetical protein [Verrucomicrobiae bacterium]
MRTTLIRIGVGAGLVIVALTGITFFLIFRAVEERGKNHLAQYVEERAKREQISLTQIRDNL